MTATSTFVGAGSELGGATCPAGKRALAVMGSTDAFNMLMTDTNVGRTSRTVRWESDHNASLTGISTVKPLCGFAAWSGNRRRRWGQLRQTLAVRAPSFDSLADYRSRLDDLELWQPYLDAIVGEIEAVAGFNPTFPTFVCGDAVVKFFGFVPRWRETFEAERLAYGVVTPDLLAPHLLGSGEAGWPYLLISRTPGVMSMGLTLAADQQLALARAVGEQVGRLHATPIPDGLPLIDPADLDIAGGAARSSLPPHLVEQAAALVDRLGSMDPVVVHSDLCAMHVFVEGGRLSGIIDWGETAVADRHHELIQAYRDLFACAADLFRIFLDAADWPMTDDFPQRALGHALVRQSRGRRIDVFMPIAARWPLDDIDTLDDLAELLFGDR